MHRLALVLDLVAEAGEPLAAAVEHAVDDVRDVALPRAELAVLARGHLEVGDRLVSQAAPDRALGRRRHGLVDAAPDQVEERRRELVRAGLAALPEQRGDEGRLRIGGRLLLVLAVVAGAALAAEEPEHRRDHEERGDGREAEDDETGPDRMRLQRVDAIVIGLVALRVGELLLHDPVECVTALHAHSGRRRERRPRYERAQLDELVGRHVDRSQRGSRADELHVTAHPHGLAPRAEDLSRGRLDPDQPREACVPLVAPDLEVDVDHVVVGDRDPAQGVRDRERARLVDRVEVPDDPHRVAAALDAERSGAPRLEARLVALPERDAPLRDGWVHERLAFPERDVAVAEVEVAGECHLEPLAHSERAVRLDVDGDVGLEEREAVCARGPRQRERGAEGERESSDEKAQPTRPRCPVASPQNATFGASRCASSSTSKNSRVVNPKGPARTAPGNVWIALW